MCPAYPANPRSGLSQIGWRTSVAHHPMEDSYA